MVSPDNLELGGFCSWFYYHFLQNVLNISSAQNIDPWGHKRGLFLISPLGVKLSSRGEDPLFAPSFFYREEFTPGGEHARV
jgi:hypothetical protein